jgi:hypothetical protein
MYVAVCFDFRENLEVYAGSSSNFREGRGKISAQYCHQNYVTRQMELCPTMELNFVAGSINSGPSKFDLPK